MYGLVSSTERYESHILIVDDDAFKIDILLDINIPVMNDFEILGKFEKQIKT